MRQKKKLKKLKKILLRVRSYGERMAALSDEELSSLTDNFKGRLNQGESLDDLLPEAYAAVCEADRRILGKFPYDVQVLGAIALHQGYLTEMNTGEGKTLVATMPLYLNALSGKSTILLTTNTYLAMRDAQEMGQVYRFMGLTVGVGVQAEAGARFTNAQKKEIYAADIVYTTHGVLGFDYLLHNLVSRASDRFLREFYYVIIDEADSVLLDGAQTPLVISGVPRVQSNLYELADFFVTTLVKDRDYELEEKQVWLTEDGVRYAERFFRIDNFYGEEHFEVNRHVTLALRAHMLYEAEKEYMVSEKGDLQLLDAGSGRLMPGVKLRGGQHQALEVKEGLKPSQENRSVASITFQNFFQLFPKMSGMSGTISDAAEELADVYHAEVLVIPPNRPLRRKDMPDCCYGNAQKQFASAMSAVMKAHDRGQPVLVVVSRIKETEYVSGQLLKAGIPHNVLNANNAFWEAEIIKEAGQKGAVTVATGMAGRGTDIRLGEGVERLGGLAVIGIGRMANVRLERQARGRAGRQGDPGTSCFFISLEDEVVQENGPSGMEKYREGRRRMSRRKVKRIACRAQKLGEELAVQSRKQSMEYDQVLRYQRNLIYGIRDRLLEGEGVDLRKVQEIARGNIRRFLAAVEHMDRRMLNRYILDHISYRLDGQGAFPAPEESDAVEEYLMKRVKQGLKEQQEKAGGRKRMEDFMRVAALQAIDDGWVEQVDYLQQIHTAVSGRASAQRDLLVEFQKDALESWQKMEVTVLKNIMRNILLGNIYTDREGRIRILLP